MQRIFHACSSPRTLAVALALLMLSACGSTSSHPGAQATTTPKPVSTGQLIYFSLPIASSTPASSTLYAIDAGSGVQAWNATIGGNIGPFIVADGVILATTTDLNTSITPTISQTAHLYGLDAHTGRQLWRQDLTKNSYLSLGIAGGLVIGTIYSSTTFQMTLIALKPADGSQVWQALLPGYSIPNTIASGQGMIFVSTTVDSSANSKLLAFDSGTGKVIWHQTPATAVVNLAFAGNTLYAGTQGTENVGNAGSFSGQQIVALNATTGQQIWQKTQDGFMLAAANSTGALVYVQISSGITLFALKASDGSQVWQAPLHGLSYASDTTVYGVTFPPTTSGATPTITETGIFALNASTGAQIWNSPLAQQIVGHLAVGDGALFVNLVEPIQGGVNEIEALRLSDGSISWKYPVNSPLTGGLVVG